MIRFKPVPKNIHQRIASLPDHFGVNPNIIFAYLFGGPLKERPNPLSDIDLAVYVRQHLREFFDFQIRERDILKRRCGIG